MQLVEYNLLLEIVLLIEKENVVFVSVLFGKNVLKLIRHLKYHFTILREKFSLTFYGMVADHIFQRYFSKISNSIEN